MFRYPIRLNIRHKVQGSRNPPQRATALEEPLLAG